MADENEVASFWATYSGRGIRAGGHTVCSVFTLHGDSHTLLNGGADAIKPSLEAVAGAKTLRGFHGDVGQQLAFVAVKLSRHNPFSTNPTMMHLFFNTLHGAWIVARSIPIADKCDTLKTHTAVEDAGDRQYMSLIHLTEQRDVGAIRPALRYEGAVAYCMSIPKIDMARFKTITQSSRVVPIEDRNTVGVSVLSFRLAAAEIASIPDVWAVAMFTVQRADIITQSLGAVRWDDSKCALWRDPSDQSRPGFCLRLVDGGPGMAPVPASFGILEIESIEDAGTQDPDEPMQIDTLALSADEVLFRTQALADFTMQLLGNEERRIHRTIMYTRNPLMGILTTRAHEGLKTGLPRLVAETVLSVIYTGEVVQRIQDEWLHLGPSVPDVSTVSMARLFAHFAGVHEQVEPLVALYAARNVCLGNSVDMVVLLSWFVPLETKALSIFKPFYVHPRTKKYTESEADHPTELANALKALHDFTLSMMHILLFVINDAPSQTKDYINTRLQALGDARLLADDLEERVDEFAGTMKREKDAYARAGWIAWAARIVFAHPSKVPGVDAVHTLTEIRKLDADFGPDDGGWITPMRRRGVTHLPREVRHRKPPVKRPDTPPGFWDMDFPPSQEDV